MKICLIAEGSYPYVTGGVSSWIQMLISWMSEHEFIVCSIRAQEREKTHYNYKIPDNVVAIKEVFLDQKIQRPARWGIRFGLNPNERRLLMGHLMGEETDWNELFLVFIKYTVVSVHEFLMSKDFYDISEEVCIKKYPFVPFTSFYWSLRSMMTPILFLIQQGVPQADLYHSASGGYAGILGGLGKFLYKKPFILTEHGIYTREREEEIIKSQWIKGCFKELWIDYFHSLSGCAYNNADKVISLFERNKQIQVELGCDEKKIHIIPNGIQANNFLNLSPKQSFDDFINVGAVVRIVPIKDIKTMIQAFAIAKKRYNNIRCYIMGPFDENIEYYKECRQLVDNLDLKDVIFTGRVNIAEYLGKMDILVLSSISEGQPLAIMEGMASHKPFVVTDVGGCRELIHGNGDDYGEAGIVVPVMDYEKMGMAIADLCKDRELRNRMGKNGLKRVMNLYSKERLINEYKRIYNCSEVTELWQG